MKKLILPLLALSLAGSAYADLTITQKIDDGQQGGEKTMTMKIKDQKMRMDVGPTMSVIVDLKSGDTTSFIHPQKMVIKASGDKIKEMQKAAAAQGSTPKFEAPKATGQKETINGYACEEYEMTANGAKMDLWMTKDVPVAEKAMAELSAVGAGTDPVQNALKSNQLSGFPMRTVIDMPGMGKTTVTVVGLSESAIPDSDFAAPAGYKEIQMPTMPGQ